MRFLNVKKAAYLSFILLGMAAVTHAENIIVNTREDQFDAGNTEDTECSLREAIYVTNNIYSIRDEKRRKEALKVGFGGCKGEDLNNVIELAAPAQTNNGPRLAPYSFKLSNRIGEIKITANVSIQSEETGFFAQEDFDNIPTIAAPPNARIFDIKKPTPTSAPVVVKISGVNLLGCGWKNGELVTSSRCADQGGIIRNEGRLTIIDAKIRGGVAKLGGAIYNDVRQTDLAQGGSVSLEYVELTDNASVGADGKGAAIYAAYSNITISKSLLRNNVGTTSVFNATADGGSKNIDAVVYSAPDLQDNIAIFSSVPKSSITNTTFTNNRNAFTVNVIAGVKVNNATLVNNQLGVYFDSVNNEASVTNSILFDTEAACFFSAQDKTLAHNNVFVVGKGCQVLRSLGQIGTQVANGVELIADGADGQPADGKCDAAEFAGLLCPLFKDASSPIYYFRPRMLTTYTSVADSPIINKGQGRLLSNQDSRIVCEIDDLRDDFVDRTECEIGAIELRVGNTNSQTKSTKVLYEETARVELLDILGDGQLLPSESCSRFFGPTPPMTDYPTTNESGQVEIDWVDGCIRTNKGPEHGYFYVDQATNEMVYVPRENYHGFEDIQFYVTTTTSRFSDTPNERSLLVRVRVVIHPNTVFEGSTLNLGALPIHWLAALLLLVVARRVGRK